MSQFTPREIALYSGEHFYRGNLAQGWKAYSYREVYYWGEQGRILPMPRWRGQDLKGKRLVLTYEQAIGEQIMFASMVPDLLKLGAELTIEVDARLVALFQRSFPTCTIVPFQSPWHHAVYEGDYYCLAGNPGLWLRDNKDKFPKESGYLLPRPILDTSLDRSIGLSWFSPVKRFGHNKGVPFTAFEPFLADKKYKCLNLQYGVEAPEDTRLFTRDIDLNNDLDGVAMLMSECKFIVTISNTVAHIAGGLGVPTYILLNKLHHWYWDTPFYPSITRVIKDVDTPWEEIILRLHEKSV